MGKFRTLLVNSNMEDATAGEIENNIIQCLEPKELKSGVLKLKKTKTGGAITPKSD